LGVRKIA